MESFVLLAAKVIAQTFAMFVFLTVALRVFGRGLVPQLTIVGYLIIALLGSAVEASLYGGGGSFIAGISAATTVLLADKLFMELAHRSSRCRKFLVGSPLILVHDGQIVRAHLRRSRLTLADLMSAVRMQGYDNVRDVKFAVLETNGEISVVPDEDAAS